MSTRKRITHRDESAGILAELALSLTLLITTIGGAVDISMNIVRYGELIEVAKTVTRMASKLPADANVTDSLESAAEQAITNAHDYLLSKGLNPDEYDVVLKVSSTGLTHITEQKNSPRSMAMVTVAIKRKSSMLLLPSQYLFEPCVKSTYIWENAQNITSDFLHSKNGDSTCV